MIKDSARASIARRGSFAKRSLACCMPRSGSPARARRVAQQPENGPQRKATEL